MFILTKQLKPTCTAHYLGKGFPRACKNLHGHNYQYKIEVGVDELNEYDMAIDFSQIKDVCDNWLQTHWDHKTIFSDFQEKAMAFWEEMGWEYEVFSMENANITAENMAYLLSYIFMERLAMICPTIQYVTVFVKETEGSEAQYTCKRISHDL